MPVAGTSNLPVAPRNHAWNAKAAKARVLEACNGNVACIGRAFLWRGDGDARSPEVWSLQFADIIDGQLQIVPKALAAAAGVRGVLTAALDDTDRARIQARISTIYDRVRSVYSDWPVSPFAAKAAITADAGGEGFQGIIAFEDTPTGDGRFIASDALRWEDGPWPLIFDQGDMDHTGMVVGTINSIERRGREIWGFGNLSDSQEPTTQFAVLRTKELLSEGAVGVSVSLDDDEEDMEGRVTTGRIRHVAIVDVPAFSGARLALVAAADPSWFANPGFGDEADTRLVWQEPERPEEERQLGAPLTVTDDGRIWGHAALWGRCHVGFQGTCTRPPKEPAAYRGYLTGERVKGIPTGPLVMKTTHAPDHLSAEAASTHYDHTGYAVADLTIGPDSYGIWVAGAVRPDATESDVEILRASAVSGDWRLIGGRLKLVGILAVNAPGFRVARALAASGTLITTGPGCTSCDDQLSLEARVELLERIIADSLVAGL